MKNKPMTSWAEIQLILEETQPLVGERWRYPLAQALSKLPREVWKFAIEKCGIVCESTGTPAYCITMTNKYLKGKKHMIVITPRLWYRTEMIQACVVAHEVAHAMINHERDLYKQSSKQVQKEQRRADMLAFNWLQSHYPKKKLKSYFV